MKPREATQTPNTGGGSGLALIVIGVAFGGLFVKGLDNSTTMPPAKATIDALQNSMSNTPQPKAGEVVRWGPDNGCWDPRTRSFRPVALGETATLGDGDFCDPSPTVLVRVNEDRIAVEAIQNP